MLSTFQLVSGDNVISPVLTTIREYGIWFEKEFDEYTAQQELYMKSKKNSGETVLEWHPGTNIGKWFDKHNLNENKYKSWLIFKDTPMMDRLVKLKLAEYKDAIPIAVNDCEGKQMIRVYTVDQIELYVRNIVDKNFSISSHIGIPKQIKVRESDLGGIVMPKVDNKRRKLF